MKLRYTTHKTHRKDSDTKNVGLYAYAIQTMNLKICYTVLLKMINVIYR